MFSPSPQVEAKIVDEDESCCASPCKASLHDSDGSSRQRSLSSGSRKDASTPYYVFPRSNYFMFSSFLVYYYGQFFNLLTD